MYVSMLERYPEHLKVGSPINYNLPPPGFREVTVKQFAEQAAFDCPPNLSEFRQIDPARSPNVKLKYFTTITLNWYDDGSGWAMIKDGKGGIRYFLFEMCVHEAGPDEGQYMFDHQFTCKKCGYRWGYDSSG